MGALPTISVVIPCYNAERYVAPAIRSVLAQGWPGLAVVVVDDGSTDGSADRVTADFPNVTLIRQSNQGVAAARNTGIQHSDGDWLAFLDADDIWLPGKLQAQWSSLLAHPEARMAYTAWQVWSSEDPAPAPDYLRALETRSTDEARWSGPSGWIYPDLLLSSAVWTSTVLVHRKLLEEAGLFDPTLPIGEDLDLWLRASRLTPILRVPRPYALYRLHPASITRRAPAQNYQSLVVQRAVARWGLTGPDGRTLPEAEFASALARTWSDYAHAQLISGNPGRARSASWQSLRLRPWQAQAWRILLKAALPRFRPPPRSPAAAHGA